MFQHLSNCHGEWNIVLAMLSSIPFIGFWLKTKLHSLRKKEKADEAR